MARTRILTTILIFLILVSGLAAEEQSDPITDALYNEGLRSFLLKDYEAAIQNFESLYSLNPDNLKNREMMINTLIALGDIAYKEGDLITAETRYIEVLGLSPEEPGIETRLEIVSAAWNRQLYQSAAVSAAVPQPAPQPVPAPEPTPVQIHVLPAPEPQEDKAVLALIDRLLDVQKDSQTKTDNSLRLITDQQNRDREMFLRTALIGIGIFLGAAVFIILIAVLVARGRRSAPVIDGAYRLSGSNEIPAITLDENRYVTDERHSDVLRLRKLTELAEKLNKGEDSWDNIKEYVTELNLDVKDGIISAVEKALLSGQSPDDDNVLSILMPLVTDSDEDLGKRSRELIRKNSNEDLDLELSDPFGFEALLTLSRLADLKTSRLNHSYNVSSLAEELALGLNRSDVDPDTYRRVGLALDLGFLEIDQKIMLKADSLKGKDLSLVQSHGARGAQLLELQEAPEEFITGITMHHERLDGSGYPQGLEGEAIPILARVMAVSDVFCALRAARPHREAYSLETSLNMIEELSGKQLDQDVVALLFKITEDRKD